MVTTPATTIPFNEALAANPCRKPWDSLEEEAGHGETAFNPTSRHISGSVYEMTKIRIVHAEDHDLVRFGLRYVLTNDSALDLVAEAESLAETLELIEALAPDLVVLDLSLSDGPALERIPDLVNGRGNPKVLVHTANSDMEIHRMALQMGARGICPKTAPGPMLLKAIRCVHQGEVWIDHSTASDFVSHFQNGGTPLASSIPANGCNGKLTAREHQIAVLAAQGLQAKKIAYELMICDKTVRNQLSVIYSKFNVSCQIELAMKARDLGLL
jgi:DNA-binding NarL/FixJ family response regulator